MNAGVGLHLLFTWRRRVLLLLLLLVVVVVSRASQ